MKKSLFILSLLLSTVFSVRASGIENPLVTEKELIDAGLAIIDQDSNDLLKVYYNAACLALKNNILWKVIGNEILSVELNSQGPYHGSSWTCDTEKILKTHIPKEEDYKNKVILPLTKQGTTLPLDKPKKNGFYPLIIFLVNSISKRKPIKIVEDDTYYVVTTELETHCSVKQKIVYPKQKSTKTIHIKPTETKDVISTFIEKKNTKPNAVHLYLFPNLLTHSALNEMSIQSANGNRIGRLIAHDYHLIEFAPSNPEDRVPVTLNAITYKERVFPIEPPIELTARDNFAIFHRINKTEAEIEMIPQSLIQKVSPMEQT